MKKKFRQITVNGIEYAWNVKPEYDDWPFQPLLIWKMKNKSSQICNVRSFHNLAIKPKNISNIIENLNENSTILTDLENSNQPLFCYLIEVCSNLEERDKVEIHKFHKTRGHRLNYFYPLD